MKKLFILIATMMAAGVMAQVDISSRIFTAEGPEKSYNQIRIVNETSQENFRCQLVVLNDDNSIKELYGIYELKEKGDSDSNTNRFKQGTRFGIQLPNDFPAEVSFVIEYKDFPLFDAIIIHLHDKNSEFGDEFK